MLVACAPIVPGDSLPLSGAMNRMMSLDQSTRAAMGQKHRIRVGESFSLKSVLNRWDALYQDLLQAREVL